MIPKIIPWDECNQLPVSYGNTAINDDLIGHLEWLNKEEAACKKVYRKSINLNYELVVLLIDSGGEHLTTKNESLINSLYKEYLEKSAQHQANGTVGGKYKRDQRAEIIWKKNQDLNHKSKRQQAQIILNDWEERGDGEDKPSYKTIIRWLEKWDKSQTD